MLRAGPRFTLDVVTPTAESAFPPAAIHSPNGFEENRIWRPIRTLGIAPVRASSYTRATEILSSSAASAALMSCRSPGGREPGLPPLFVSTQTSDEQ
jgi:hypothetical protein